MAGLMELEYTEVDGLLYHNIDIGEGRLQNLGKFGKARLEYLHCQYFAYYRDLLIMDNLAEYRGLLSSYTVAQFRPHVEKCNESKVENVEKKEFSGQPQYNVVVSDLTYVRVGMSWHYLCVLADLFNHEIIGYSTGKNKDVNLVSKAGMMTASMRPWSPRRISTNSDEQK